MRALALLLILLVPDELAAIADPPTMSKIVGGTPAKQDKYPFYIALVPNTSLNSRASRALVVWCGATLVTATHLVTAAHCYYPLRRQGGNWMSKLSAVFQLKNRCQRTWSEVIPISRVDMHPRYDPNTIRNDIAVATMKRASSLSPAYLPAKGRGGVQSPATVIGYGSTAEGSRSEPCTLLEADVTIYTRNQCLKTNVANEIRRLPGVVCAGVKSGAKDTWDSGGPLLKIVDGNYYLQGITSFGNGCGRRNSPGVYTDVSYYRAWIDTKIIGRSAQETVVASASSTSTSSSSSAAVALSTLTDYINNMLGHKKFNDQYYY